MLPTHVRQIRTTEKLQCITAKLHYVTLPFLTRTVEHCLPKPSHIVCKIKHLTLLAKL